MLSYEEAQDLNDWWDNFEQLFDLYDELMHGIRFEEAAEAIDRTVPIQAEEDGSEIRPPGTIPYRRVNNTAYLKQCHQAGCAAAVQIRILLKKRELSLELLTLWGEFRFNYGVLSAVENPRGDDLGPLRSGKRGGRPANYAARTWVAKQLATRMHDGMKRPDAAVDLARQIRSYEKDGFADGYDLGWKLINERRELKSTYEAKNFSDFELAEYAGVPLAHLYPKKGPEN